MKVYLGILIAPVLLTISSCEKDEIDELPKATQQGKNTFGCLIDGQAFLPKRTEGTVLRPSPGAPLTAYYVKRTFDILATGGGRRVFFRAPGVIRAGTYTLDKALQGNSYGYYSINSGDYYTDDDTTLYTGQVQLSRFDTVAKVAAGTFEFTARNFRSGEVVHLTQGRFDVRLP